MNNNFDSDFDRANEAIWFSGQGLAALIIGVVCIAAGFVVVGVVLCGLSLIAFGACAYVITRSKHRRNS